MVAFRGGLAGFVAIPAGPLYSDVLRAVAESFIKYDIQQIASPCEFTSSLLSLCKKADLLIADISEANPSTYYVIGVAQASQKPVLILSHDVASTPFDISGFRVLRYNQNTLGRLSEFLGHWLADIVREQNLT